MGDVVIRAERLGKRYRIGTMAPRYRTLRDSLSAALAAPWRRLRGARADDTPDRTFWALKDVSFAVDRGEVVGVIGRNGAGKSTLLKILSRITEPTEGEADLHGRVGSLLEVGTGFNPELTGRENIFLNGAILGMRREEIRRKFEEIVAFAEVEQFLDTPVKHYSSGMYMRLAFAVAAHLEPEILVVDEVLAVGDAAFQEKCLGKMSEVSRSGRTVLFVSHNMNAVRKLCGRAIVLGAGQVRFVGPADRAVTVYEEQVFAVRQGGDSQDFHREGSGEYRFREARAEKAIFQPEEPKRFFFRIGRQGPKCGRLFLSGLLRDAVGCEILQLDSRLVAPMFAEADEMAGHVEIAGPWLKPGEYRLDLWICASNFIDKWEEACHFRVAPTLPYPFPARDEVLYHGVVLGDFRWTIEPEGRPPG